MKRFASFTLLASAVACLVTSVADARSINGHGAFSPSHAGQACFGEWYGGIKNNCSATEGSIYFNLPVDAAGEYYVKVWSWSVGTSGASFTCKAQANRSDGSQNDSSREPTTILANYYPNTQEFVLGGVSVPENGTLRVVCDKVPSGRGISAISWQKS